MKRFMLGIFIAVPMLASCASGPGLREEDILHEAGFKQCGDTPKNVIDMFFEGIKGSFWLLRSAVAGESVVEVFKNDAGQQGEAVLRELAAHPELVGEDGSCACTPMAVIDTTDPNEKIVIVRRYVTSANGDVHTYKRAFKARFTKGNCLLSIQSIDSKWARIPD